MVQCVHCVPCVVKQGLASVQLPHAQLCREEIVLFLSGAHLKEVSQ